MNIKQNQIAVLEREIKRLRKLSIKQKKQVKELEKKIKEKEIPSSDEDG